MDVLDFGSKVRSASWIVDVKDESSKLIEALAPDKAMTHSPPVAANLCHPGGSVRVSRRDLGKDIVEDVYVEERINFGPVKVVSHLERLWFVFGVVRTWKTLEGLTCQCILIGKGPRNKGSPKPDSRQQPPHDKAQKFGSENVEDIIKERNHGALGSLVVAMASLTRSLVF
jgi:hypothetical protein